MTDVKYDKRIEEIKRVAFDNNHKDSMIKTVKYNTKSHVKDILREDPRSEDSSTYTSDYVIEYQCVDLIPQHHETMSYRKELVFEDLEILTEKFIKPFVTFQGEDKVEAFKLLSILERNDLGLERSLVYKKVYQYLLFKVNTAIRNYFKSSGSFILSNFKEDAINKLHTVLANKEATEQYQWFSHLVLSLRKLFNVEANRDFIGYFKNQGKIFLVEPLYLSKVINPYHALVLVNRVVEINKDSEETALYHSLENIFNRNKQYEFNYWLYTTTTKNIFKFKVQRTKDQSYILSYQGMDV